MAKQLDKDSRKVLHRNLNTRIENAEIELKKLTHYPELNEGDEGYNPETNGKPKPEKEIGAKDLYSINHLKSRIMHLQLSLRLVWNTDWIIEQRKEDIEYTAKILKEDFGPGAEMDEEKKKLESRLILRLNEMTKASKCKRKGCYIGRGYIGMNASTGEFVLCKCAEDTINYYKLHD